MAFDFTTLVTDRTQADYERFEYLRDKGFANMTTAERSQWNGGKLKGAYNTGDLNRAGEALNYLRDKLNEAGYITYQTDFVAKTNWAVTSIPTAEDLSYYVRAVANIRNALAVFSTTAPAPTDTGALTIDEANNIEKILIDVETLINNMLAARLYCADIYAGEI